MIIFRQTRGLKGGVISGGKGPAVLSLLRDKEAGRVKVFITLNKVREKIKTLRKVMRILTRSL